MLICNKKRISTLAMGLIFFCQAGNAQELGNVQDLWDHKELSAARQEVDAYLLRKPLDAQGWLLKARICNAISNDPGLKNSIADGRMHAFQALQKAMKLDAVQTGRELGKDNFSLPLQLYTGYQDDAIAIFNTAIAMDDANIYGEALGIFKKASSIGSYIYSNRWGLQAIDSNNLFYSARAAVYAGKTDEAVQYAKKIADAGIVETLANKEFEPVYKWLVYHYRTTNDEAGLKKYTAAGIRHFPLSHYYDLNYIDWLRAQRRTDDLIKSYRQMFLRGIDNTQYRYAYLVDLFTGMTDQANYKQLLQSELSNYIKKNPAEVKGKLLFGKYYINEAAAIQKTQAANKRALITALLRSSNKFLLEIVERFSKTDRAVYNEALQLLVANFEALNESSNAKKYKTRII